MDSSTYGLPACLMADLTGVHIDTARRWKRSGTIPKAYRMQIGLMLEGDLGAINARWTGWRLREEGLWTPEGNRLSPGDLRAIPYRIAQIDELRKILRTPLQREFFPGS